jgi:hypothetical protein
MYNDGMRQDPVSGRFIGPSETAETRFWRKVDKSADCWLWTAAHIPLGYGYFWDGRRVIPAHRFAYELLVGPIPKGLVLDHLCRVPACVNPTHMEPVRQQLNTQRGLTGRVSGAQQRAKTRCPKGHPYDDTNTYTNPTTGARHCRICRARSWKR